MAAWWIAQNGHCLHLFVHTLIVIFWYGRRRTQHLEPCPGIVLPLSNWSMHRRCFLPKKNWEEWRYHAVSHKISYVIKVFNHHCTAPLPGPMTVHFEARLRPIERMDAAHQTSAEGRDVMSLPCVCRNVFLPPVVPVRRVVFFFTGGGHLFAGSRASEQNTGSYCGAAPPCRLCAEIRFPLSGTRHGDPRSLPRGCRKRVSKLERCRVARFTHTSHGKCDRQAICAHCTSLGHPRKPQGMPGSWARYQAQLASVSACWTRICDLRRGVATAHVSSAAQYGAFDHHWSHVKHAYSAMLAAHRYICHTWLLPTIWPSTFAWQQKEVRSTC